MRVVTSAQKAELDRHTIDVLGVPGVVLMERAALGCTAEIVRRVGSLDPDKRTAAVLVGPGNNGGDGSAIARQLLEHGFNVEIVLAADPDRVKGDALVNLDIAQRLNIPVHASDSAAARAILERAHVWVDSVLGNGLKTAPRGAPGDLLRLAMRIRSQRNQRPFVLAVDIPSGVSTDTGACLGTVLPADVTATMAFPKWGHYLAPAINMCGELVVVEIGIPNGLSLPDTRYGVVVDEPLARSLRWRTLPSDHKGTNGRLLVVAGSESMPGAGTLCCRAALRTGAALVTQSAPLSARQITIGSTPEVMGTDPLGDGGVPNEYGAIVFGPGKGRSRDAGAELSAVFASQSGKPLVLDADGLHLLAASPDRPRTGPLVLTPHPGELAALLDTSTAAVVADLVGAARACADRYDAVVVAKTAGAVIAGEQLHFVPPGDPGMATGGSGDVLTGIIAACALRLDPETAAVLGTWFHAQAGRVAADRRGSVSMTAGDIVDAIRIE